MIELWTCAAIDVGSCEDPRMDTFTKRDDAVMCALSDVRASIAAWSSEAQSEMMSAARQYLFSDGEYEMEVCGRVERRWIVRLTGKVMSLDERPGVVARPHGGRP